MTAPYGISNWSISKGDYNRDSDYDESFNKLARKRKIITKFSVAMLVLSSLIALTVLMNLSTQL